MYRRIEIIPLPRLHKRRRFFFVDVERRAPLGIDGGNEDGPLTPEADPDPSAGSSGDK